MAEFRIAVDLSDLMPPHSALNRSVFPSLAYAVQVLLDRIETTWKGFAAGAPLPNGKSIGIRTGEYLRSINQRKLGDFAGEVFSEIAYAEIIERGAPARDLKDMLNSSLKVRISSRTGKRYLIIPFRQDTGRAMSGGNPMPEAVRQWWQGQEASFVRSVGERPVHSDIRGTVLPWHEVHQLQPRRVLGVAFPQLLMTPSRTYSWGSRLGATDLQAMGANARQVRQMSGMVLFRKQGTKGGRSHSQYITFRTMSETSPPGSWQQKARTGYWPAKTTADLYRPIAEKVFTAAVEEDIRRLLP